MRALIFGCPHVQPSATLGSAAFQQTVEWLRDQALQLQATHVICLGDTVESVAKTDLPANIKVKWFLDTFKAVAQTGCQVYWMIGNHDVYSEMYSALDIFEDGQNFRVVRQPLVVPGEIDITLWPFQQWMDDPMKWPEHTDELFRARINNNPRALFAHVPIEGMPMGGTKDKGADLVDIGLQYDMIFAGHYHIANQFMAKAMSAETQVVVPGCAIGHDFKDLGWFHGAVLWDYTPGSQGGSVAWLPNPYSSYFYHGTSADLNEQLQDVNISALRDRLHVRFTDKVDSAPYRQWGIPTVQVRPKHEQVKTSSHESFALEGDPIADLQRWLTSAGHEQTGDLLSLAREYLA